MDFLANVNPEQLLTTGGWVGFVIWLYAKEREDKNKWIDRYNACQEARITELRHATEVMSSANATMTKVLEVCGE